MTGIAIQVGWDVRGFFALRKGAIMTTATGTDHFIVINFGGWRPAGFTVATVTGIAGINVFRALTFGAGTIMTGRAGA